MEAGYLCGRTTLREMDVAHALQAIGRSIVRYGIMRKSVLALFFAPSEPPSPFFASHKLVTPRRHARAQSFAFQRDAYRSGKHLSFHPGPALRRSAASTALLMKSQAGLQCQ